MSANHANYWQRQFQSQQQLTDDLSGQLDVLSTQHAEALRELSSEGQGQVELLQRERDLWRTRAREAEDRLRGTLAARVTKAESPATQAAGDGQRGLSALQPQAEPSTAGEVAESAKHPPSTPGNLGIGGGASDSGSDWEDGPIRPSTLGALGDAEGPPIDAAKAEEVPSPAQAAAPGDLPASDPVKSAATIATLSQANTALEAKVCSVSRMLADAEARLRRDRAALDDARTRAIKAESQARAAAFQSAQTAIDEANRTADRARAQERESASAADEARSEAAVLRLRLHRAEGLVTSLRTKVQGLEAAAHAAAAREREMATQLSAESHRGAVAEGETRSATSQHEADIRRLRIALATVHAEKAEAITRPGWLQPTPGTPGSALGLFTHDIQRALERARADEARRRELAEDAAEQAQSQALMATATAQKTIGEAVAEAERALLIKMGDAEAVAVQEAHEAGRREGEAQAEASSQSERQRLLDKLRLETNATLKAVRDASMRRAEQIVLEERRKSEAAVRDLSQALQEAEAREAQAERSTSALQARIAELQEQHLADASALRTEADRALQDMAERVETLTRKHEDELERLHEELRRASRPPAADASPKAVDDDADAKREEAWRAREAELEARFSEQIIAQAEAHERTIQDVTWQWQTKHAQVQAELAEANAMLAAPRPRPPSQGRLSDAPTPDAETERVRPLPVIATKAAAAAVSAQLDPGSPSGPEPVPKAADAGQQAEAESPECRSAAAAQQPQSTGGALAPDAAEASAKAAEFHASVAQARAEISADFAARLQAAAQAKQAALARMEQDLKEDLERAVAEERSRGAAEREQAVSRVEEHAAAAINVLEVKLRAAVQAKKRAESLADSLQVSLDVAKREAVQSAFKAELFHKVSMLLRLRLAVAAARYTAEYCSRTSEVKRALGKRIVLLESRYESDVVAHKKRADAAIKRCVSVEHALLGVASIVGLQFESSMAAASSAGHQLLTDRPGQETALTTACLDGSGTGEAARRAKRELMETQDRVFAIKAELAELREELEAARAKRDHVVGVARFLDMEINQLGRQVALSSTAANEIVASRLQRLHKRLEADLSTAEVVRSRIHELEGRIDVLKDERRGLKLRGRAIEAGVLEKVVKQHMDVRALLHATQLGPEALLPARMGRLPEPPPLRLAMLQPRHALDVDGYEYDLGRRDYLRARAVKEGAAALKRLRSGTARASRPAGAAKASGDEEPDPDSDCPALRLLPAALFSEESKKVRQPEAEHIHDLLHSSEYEAAAGPGYGEAAARGHIVASGSAASAAAANELAKRVQSTGGLLFAGGSASAPSASSASFASGADRTSAGSGPDSSRAALSADDARILNALVPLASARQ
ncbi:hypothetical protein FNF29_02480 [Cafeteria roenbergensis]|uniref:Uncharacterized protein n=1 Tax=Cafeteria roenbergensis TaxID=33653 RepID=A0A5A8CPY5_CAFRO|nr:hypothetical protein FNF29_02480 [Cafeteria roenbergensis]|eukprot:KAA0154260.1 hypothetical protein FNF29_02480 [Cafeteria roenbergensis]